MGLRARRQGNDLEVTWSRDSALIGTATSGVIAIEDGTSKRQILLDATQVHYGSLLYSPTSDQIQMELTVYTPAATNTESVLVILPKGGAPQTYAMVAPTSTAPTAHREAAAETMPIAQPTRAFIPPAPKQAAGLSNIPAPSEAPAVSIPVNSALGSIPLVSQAPVAPPPMPSAPSALRPAASPGKPAPPPIAYQPPEAIRRVLPRYPARLQALITAPKMIEVRVTIDKTGKVTNAELIPSPETHQAFVEPSLTAARAWWFQPARRGDEAIPSESILRFVFKR